MHTVRVLLCFFVIWHQSILSISLRVTNLALDICEVTLKDTGEFTPRELTPATHPTFEMCPSVSFKPVYLILYSHKHRTHKHTYMRLCVCAQLCCGVIYYYTYWFVIFYHS